MATRCTSPHCTALLAWLLLPAAQAVTLVNGGLESPSAGTYQAVAAGALANGWLASGSRNIEFVRVGHTTNGDTIASAAEGEWFVDLNGTQGPGAISQSIATQAGQALAVQFWMSGNPGPNGVQRSGGPKTAELRWNGALAGSFSYAHQAGDDWSNLRWQAHELVVIGSGGLNTLEFRSTSTAYAAAGSFIDGVSVSAVPEPATWALMLGGAMLLAARRRNVATTAPVHPAASALEPGV